MTPTIISMADSPHYLVGLVDENNNVTGLNRLNNVEVFNSLVEAKHYLRKHHVETATIEYQTAYDEMCGSCSPSVIKQKVNLLS